MSAADFFSRSTHAVLSIAGGDAIAYLQTKLTCDTRPWRRDGGGYGFATDIQGKALFDLHGFLDGNGVLALVQPVEAVDAAIAHLDRFVIREDVRLEDRSGALCQLVLPGEAAAVGQAALGVTGDEELGWRPTRLAGVRFASTPRWPVPVSFVVAEGDAALAATVAALADAGLREAGLDAWNAWRVANDIVALGAELVPGEVIPLEAGAFHGVSFSKGCYLGQETIERLYSRGQPARRIVALQVSGTARPGDVVAVDGEESGHVTSAAQAGTGTRVLAWVRRRHLEGLDARGVTVGGVAATFAGLVGGDGRS